MNAPPHIETRVAAHFATVRAAGCALVCGALACSGAAAQVGDGPDLEPPLIEHEVLVEAEAAERQSFVAQVVDDRELASVKLFWRHAGETTFESLDMTRVSRSSTWIAQLPTPDDERSIEYWIEARDAGGNRTVRGFAFSPLMRRVVPTRARVPAGNAGPGRPRESRGGVPVGTGEGGRRNALWVVLGALGVALLVGLAASGGGSGGGRGGGGGGCGPDGCEVTLTFDTPTIP